MCVNTYNVTKSFNKKYELRPNHIFKKMHHPSKGTNNIYIKRNYINFFKINKKLSFAFFFIIKFFVLF